MECVEVEMRLSALLDGELNREEVIAIEAHVADCLNCSQVREEMSAALEQAQEWHIDNRNIDEAVLRRITHDEMASVFQELRWLRREVFTLHQEVVDLKGRLERRDDRSRNETSALRYPYAKAQTAAHHTL